MIDRPHAILPSKTLMAFTEIVTLQALWRGYSFRKRLLTAFESAKEGLSESSDEDIAEVDLSAFDFNMDDDWLPPDAPQLPQKYNTMLLCECFHWIYMYLYIIYYCVMCI